MNKVTMQPFCRRENPKDVRCKSGGFAQRRLLRQWAMPTGPGSLRLGRQFGQ
jgi:hypothetical protein